MHEQAHASNAHRVRSHRVFKNGASGLSQPRIGFALLDAERLSGYLFEEGWADMHRAEYIELNASPQYKQALSEAANWRDMELHETLHITTPQKESVALPLKYCHLTPQGGLTFTVSAYAGYAMELILNKHPHLREMMREARRSVDGLRVFAREIEGIKPGLYRRIRSYYYTEDDFGEALSYVTREISDGIAAIVSDNTNPRLRQYWHTALADKTPKPE